MTQPPAVPRWRDDRGAPEGGLVGTDVVEDVIPDVIPGKCVRE